ncbi:MAG: glycosyltransferase family 4 protein [Thiofilum sp.]|uniref:glycosyltransferase family 4 protein n=1 Tax=Thiofilum sp. TaxID=2212733 RepID=UPI0025EA7AB9|nr:glycosyltransferase family 4 protein [Thiofilum sp.]MBK8451882.1 glycosyltransferase family 4 protein [Thiofilum sp.]
MKPLTILHTESSCGWGGQEIRILTEAQGFIERGHAIQLLCPRESTIYKAALKQGIPVVAAPIARKNLSGLYWLRKWLQTHIKTFDLINTHSSTDSWLVALAQQLLLDKRPIVRTRHVSSPISLDRATRWLYQSAAQHIVVTGEPLKRHLIEHNHFVAKHITSIPTGIDLSRFFPRDSAAIKVQLGIEGTIIGILATLRNWKGHHYLIEAFKLLSEQHTDLRLLIVGDGPQADNINKFIDQLGLKSKVLCVGQQDNPELWLNAMDIFVLPSYGDEGVSQAVMQAMASRIPVITTAVGGMTDAVQDGDTGLLVDTHSSQAIVNAINKLLQQPVLAQQLAIAGYERAQALFGVVAMLDKMEMVFQSVLKK